MYVVKLLERTLHQLVCVISYEVNKNNKQQQIITFKFIISQGKQRCNVNVTYLGIRLLMLGWLIDVVTISKCSTCVAR